MSSCRLCNNSLERKKSQEESKLHILHSKLLGRGRCLPVLIFLFYSNLLTFNFVDIYVNCPILCVIHRYLFLASHALWVWNMNPSFHLQGRLVASTVKNVLPAWWKNSIILNFALRLFCYLGFRIWLK